MFKKKNVDNRQHLLFGGAARKSNQDDTQQSVGNTNNINLTVPSHATGQYSSGTPTQFGLGYQGTVPQSTSHSQYQIGGTNYYANGNGNSSGSSGSSGGKNEQEYIDFLAGKDIGNLQGKQGNSAALTTGAGEVAAKDATTGELTGHGQRDYSEQDDYLAGQTNPMNKPKMLNNPMDQHSGINDVRRMTTGQGAGYVDKSPLNAPGTDVSKYDPVAGQFVKSDATKDVGRGVLRDSMDVAEVAAKKGGMLHLARGGTVFNNSDNNLKNIPFKSGYYSL